MNILWDNKNFSHYTTPKMNFTMVQFFSRPKKWNYFKTISASVFTFLVWREQHHPAHLARKLSQRWKLTFMDSARVCVRVDWREDGVELIKYRLYTCTKCIMLIMHTIKIENPQSSCISHTLANTLTDSLSAEFDIYNGDKHIKYAANCTDRKLSQCSAIIFFMRMSHRIRQYQLKKNL